MNPQTLDQKLCDLNKELEEIHGKEVALAKIRSDVEQKINAINIVMTLFSPEDDDDHDFMASLDAHMERNATIPERVLQALAKHNGPGLTTGQIGDLILSEGFANPSATFKISVSTACSRLAEKGKLAFTTGPDGKKLYTLPEDEWDL